MDFKVFDIQIRSEPGYMSWGDLHKLYDHEQKLDANLRKADKLSYQGLHPGNNKQCVSLALAVFDDTTIAACKGLFPERKDMLMFLKLINVWWTCANSNSLYTSNPIANAMIPDDERLDFFIELSDWLESWAAECTNFGLSKQTFNALTLTLRSQSMMIRDLFADGFKFLRCRQLQSDPIERRFSQYRAMSGGRFLVSLREVQTSEKILKSRSLLKIGFDYWTEHIEEIKDDAFSDETKKFLDTPKSRDNEIHEVCLPTESEEVSHFIAGNIG